MTSKIAALFGLAISLVAISAPAAHSQIDLFPVALGNTWKMSGFAGPQKLEMVATITKSKSANGSTKVTMSWNQGENNINEETYIIRKQYVARSTSGIGGTNIIDPPVRIIVYPMAVGNSWTWKGTISTPKGVFEGTSTLRVGAKETVKTTSKSYKAFRVDMVMVVSGSGQKVSIPNSYWFAPGVGMVRQKSEIPNPNGEKVSVDAKVTEVDIKK